MLINRILIVIGLFGLAACSRPGADSSNSKISIDTRDFRAAMSAKNPAMMSAAGLPTDAESCYAAELAASGKEMSFAKCEPARFGLIADFVEAGKVLSLDDVPFGTYTFRLYLYKRNAGDACESLKTIVGDKDRERRLYLVTKETTVTIGKPEESISAAVDFPGVGQTISAMRPAACRGADAISSRLKVVVGKMSATGANGEHYELKVLSRGVVK